MKKLVFFLSLFIVAQTLYGQKIGVRAGLNLSTASVKTDAFTIDSKTLTGFQAGLTLETPIGENMFFNTALLYSAKGYKGTLIVSYDARVNYLDIPLNFEYKESVGNVAIFLEAGPYIGIGLAGKTKTGNTSVDVDFGSDPGEIKRFDIGLNFGGGVEIDKLRLGINYGLGLINLSNEDNTTYKMRNFAIFANYVIN